MNKITNLYLANLSGYDEAGVKSHIAENYAGSFAPFDYGEPSDKDKADLSRELEKFDVLVAYEHVGSWGCDSSSYFLMRDKKSGEYKDFTGSHCSCFGFKGQYEPEDTSLEYIASDKFSFYGGGYDEDSEKHKQMIRDFAIALLTDMVKDATGWDISVGGSYE